MMRYLLFFLVVFYSLRISADERRALRLFEKRDFEKLKEVLDKDVEKDSINPGAYYIYSLLYNEPLYDHHNLDSSYLYILKSVKTYPLIDSRDERRLDKLGINDSVIHAQKKKIEYLAFERARGENTVQAFNDYILNYDSSSYLMEAIEERNELAFQKAADDNTYLAYYQFMQVYPESKQYDEAKKRYERLLYEYHTKDDDLESYEDFIKRFPDSPFRREAITVIYNIRTINNEEQSLMNFIRDFPDAPEVNDAIDRLYHNYISSGEYDFSYQYNFISIGDSIKNVNRYEENLILPVYEEGHYGFITDKGERIIPVLYNDIDVSYLCGNIRENYLIVTKGNERQIIGKTGALIYNGPFYNVDDIGYGLLRISDNARYGLIYKSGKIIFQPRFDEIQRLDHQLLKVSEDDFWKIYSLNGQLLLSDQFQEIRKEGEFILFKKDRKWAITNNEQIFEWYRSGQSNFRFIYDDYVLIEPTQILCFRGEQETIIDKDLERKIPLQDQDIFALPEGWLVRKDTVYEIYDDAFFKISGSGFEKIEYKGNWISGKFDDKWIVYNKFAPIPDVFVFDSVNILNEQFVLVFSDNDPYLIFDNLKKEKLHPYDEIRILKHQAEAVDSERIPEFLMIEYPNGRKSVYNSQGKEILKGDYESIQALGPEYLRISRRGKAGLVDTSGNMLLKTVYNSIANYTNGYVSLLLDKEFGLYNRRKGLYLKPDYDRIVKPYDERFLIAYEDGGYGLLDHNGEKITEMIFDDILQWTDSVILVQESGFWHLYDIYNDEYLIEGIYKFEYLNDEDNLKIILFRKDEHYGVLNNNKGIVINSSFNDILNLGNKKTPIYFAEKYIPEAEFYIVIYYNSEGEVIRKQVFTDQEYNKIYCN